jgi:hypothetical protein
MRKQFIFLKHQKQTGNATRSESVKKIYEVGKAVTSVTSLNTNDLNGYIFGNGTATASYINDKGEGEASASRHCPDGMTITRNVIV